MLKFGNKEFRNLQEQVLKNMRDIANIKSSGIVLDEFGIKVVGQEDTVAQMPTVEDYKLVNPDWAYGDAYAIGTEAPYTLYILTREDANHQSDYWFDIGDFPAPGPEGPQGPQGETGPQGQTGNPGADGAAAGFGTVSASATTLTPGSDATVSVTASGPNTEKSFVFTFGIPKGDPGDSSDAVWGNISGDLGDQTDLVNALQAKQNLLVSGTNIKTINNTSILGSGNIDIQSAVWGNITGTLSNQTDLQTALNAKQDAIADLSTIRAGAAAGATAVQPAAINNMVTTNGWQIIIGDKTFTGILNKNTNGYGLIMPSTTSFIQNKVLATTDMIKEIYQHYITFKANNNKTVISVKVLTQSNIPMTADEFFSFVNQELPDSTGNIVATGTIHISNVDHKYVGAIGKGSTSSTITVYPLVSTGGYDSIVSLAASAITSFVDVVDRVGAHGAGASGSIITRQDIIDALGYIPSHVEANPSSTTGTLTGIGIDGVNYAIQGGGSGTITDVEVNGTSVVSGGVANIDLTGYALTSSLADVATTGNYNDLINKPTIPTNYVTTNTAQTITGSKDFKDMLTISSSTLGERGTVALAIGNSTIYENYDDPEDFGYFIIAADANLVLAPDSNSAKIRYTNKNVGSQTPNYLLFPDGHYWTANKTVATTDQLFSGNYNDLSNKPSIPTKTSDLTNDSGFITKSVNDLTNYTLSSSLATVATSGDYTDLDNTPDLSIYAETADLGTAAYINENALSIAYSQITGTPTIPTKTSDLTNDSGFITSSALSGYATETWVGQQGYITGIDSTDVITALGYTPGTSNFSGSYNDLSNKPDLSVYALSSSLATVATSGSYNDLINKPSIPTKTSDLQNDSGFITGVTWNDVTNKPSFATVATSGDYDDLINKPTIPVVPTNVSSFTNDAGYITSNDIPVTDVTLGGTSVLSSGVAVLPAYPTVPTTVSSFTNDAGYQTASDVSTTVSTAISSQTKETWTFTLSDGTTTTKTIVLG